MSKKNERIILFLDLHIKTKTRSQGIKGLPNNFTLDELLEKVTALRLKNMVNVVRGSGNYRTEVYLADIKHDPINKCWKLLINITDTTLADEVHREIGGNEGTRKVNSKTNGVGTDFSSHIIIKSDPQLDGSWVALYEQSYALPVKLVASYLNEILKSVAKDNKDTFEIDHPKYSLDSKGSVKKINTYCIVHFNGHVSDQFKNDLNDGSLKALTLITGEMSSIVGYDSQKHTNVKEIRLPIKIDKADIIKAGGNYNWIDKLRRKDAKDLKMQEIKVSFKDDGDISHTAEIDIVTGNLVNNEKYVKKVRVSDFSDMLTTSVNQIHEPIISKMLEHV